ncbi:MAG TPA: HAD-IA family hydrolase [Chitinophagaceae bacterium]
MINMVVFDMAGTTVNEGNIVYKTLQQSINAKGFDFTLEQVLAEGAGKEKFEAIKSILAHYANNHDEELAAVIYKNFIAQLAMAYETFDILPQSHAEKLFQELRKKNIRIALNTGYNEETAWSLIDKLGWREGVEFETLVTADDVKNNRPNPDMIRLAMLRFGITDVSTVAKVGDSIIDIEEGKNARCGLTIGITSGAHTHDQLHSAEPDFIIDDLLELLPLLDKTNSLARDVH